MGANPARPLAPPRTRRPRCGSCSAARGSPGSARRRPSPSTSRRSAVRGAITTAKGGSEVKERRSVRASPAACVPQVRGSPAGSATSTSTKLYDRLEALGDGALKVPGYTIDGWYGRVFSGLGILRLNKPIKDYTEQGELDGLPRCTARATKVKVEGINLTYEGLIPKITKSMLTCRRTSRRCSRTSGAFVDRAVVFPTCPDCARHPPHRQRGRARLQGSRATASPTCAGCRSRTSPHGVDRHDRRSVRGNAGHAGNCSTGWAPSSRSDWGT